MYDFYIFDLDGTLLDTLDDLADSVNATLEHYGFPLVTREQVREFVGNGMKNLMERALFGVPENFDEILTWFKAHYRQNSTNKTKPYEGIIELLKRLKAEGKKTAVVSNKAHFATESLSKMYFGDLLDFTLGEKEAEGIRKKPAPDSVELALKTMGVDKSRAVYIGDSDVDILTAKNVGLPCISVTWGFRDEEFLKEHGGKIFAYTTEDIR